MFTDEKYEMIKQFNDSGENWINYHWIKSKIFEVFRKQIALTKSRNQL